MKAPEQYADLANAAEKEGRWLDAAELWIQARVASQGHNRRARYDAAAERCRKEASK